MADHHFGGTDEESAEIRKLNNEVLNEPDNFEHWEKLIRAVETLEGGLNRNSSPQAIATVRDVYDRFLSKFPLLFGYWKKYADLEFSIAGTESAELVYERGCASINNSVDLWTDYCAFKNETSHDPEVIRELYERGANCVGLDFLSHPFWDKFLEFEDRQESPDRIFGILSRIIHIPMHQYARYFERFRNMAHSRAATDLIPPDVGARFYAEVAAESESYGAAMADVDVERQIRTKIDQYHLEIFTHTQTETTKRWTYESEIKRPYFHVTELDQHQLANWRKYLDFEEAEGNNDRINFLYERCLVTCAFYDEFWFRYARWMSAKEDKTEEVRNIYQRASTMFVPISRPGVRLQWAYFEEMSGRIDVAEDIHQAILVPLPGHVETIISWANLQRRQNGLDAAINVYKSQLDNPMVDIYYKASLIVEWAALLWKIKGSVDEARQVFQENQQWYLESQSFWEHYLKFELAQPTMPGKEAERDERIKQVYQDLRFKSLLSEASLKELTPLYMEYLLEYGGKEAVTELLTLDREVNGPASIQVLNKKASAMRGQENGLANEPLRKADTSFKYFERPFIPNPSNSQGTVPFQ